MDTEDETHSPYICFYFFYSEGACNLLDKVKAAKTVMFIKQSLYTTTVSNFPYNSVEDVQLVLATGS